ncbi:hypothetical protein [Streptomyces sp. RPT161]|uniref:hypothetical protein n=1 Tax=Streptomyces sp. RPT161 TaxID=3015993 RepID=UPI0022B8FBCD|nr:hypothetical protein [Streptomyces sp. RPT161]
MRERVREKVAEVMRRRPARCARGADPAVEDREVREAGERYPEQEVLDDLQDRFDC